MSDDEARAGNLTACQTLPVHPCTPTPRAVVGAAKNVGVCTGAMDGYLDSRQHHCDS